MPVVSVITPTLNAMPYVSATLHAVRLASGPGVEHIVVDGYSEDGTWDVLSSAEGVVAFQARRRGMYNAINLGLQRSSGSILSYLNADDLVYPWRMIIDDLVYTKRVAPALISSRWILRAQR